MTKEVQIRLPYAIHVFYGGKGYTFTSEDVNARNLDLGELSSGVEIKRATEVLLGIGQGDLRDFVVDRNEQSSTVISFTVRPQEQFA